MHLNYEPWLEKILWFIHLKWLNIRKLYTIFEESSDIYFS